MEDGQVVIVNGKILEVREVDGTTLKVAPELDEVDKAATGENS